MIAAVDTVQRILCVLSNFCRQLSASLFITKLNYFNEDNETSKKTTVLWYDQRAKPGKELYTVFSVFAGQKGRHLGIWDRLLCQYSPARG